MEKNNTLPKAAIYCSFFFDIIIDSAKNINAKPKINDMEELLLMRRKTVVILALVLVFALMFTACAARRPLQTPVQPRQNTTGMFDNNKGIGNGTTTGVGTRTGIGSSNYTGNGPSANDAYDLGYGVGNNAGYNRYGAGTGMNYGSYGGYNGVNYGNTAGNPTYYGGYDNGLLGGVGTDYRNIGGSNNSPNYGINNAGNNYNRLNNTDGTTQANGIERSIKQMTGVKDATVVVSGNTAYVGLDTDGNMTGKNISYGNTTGSSALKSACAQRVKSSNPQIQTVYVSTDANFINRLRNVGNGMRNGNALSNFRNELNDLVRGLTPERQ